MQSQYISTLNNKIDIRQDNPEEIYKRPIPLDMINKFVGLDSRILQHDDTVQKQAFDQSQIQLSQKQNVLSKSNWTIQTFFFAFWAKVRQR